MNELRDERCPKCGRLLGRIYGQAEIKCSRCKELVIINTKQIKKQSAT